jgi:hypothetical protein
MASPERIVMSRKDAKRAADPGSPGSEGSPDSPGRRLSRRSLLQGAATAGAAGLAATALGAAAGPALAATSRPPAPPRPQGHGAPAGSGPARGGPIMVHVRDARSGDIEVFAGTSQTRVRDADLAARIARVIG